MQLPKYCFYPQYKNSNVSWSYMVLNCNFKIKQKIRFNQLYYDFNFSISCLPCLKCIIRVRTHFLNIPLAVQLIEGQDLLTDYFPTSTSPQTEVKDHLVSLGETCGQHDEFPSLIVGFLGCDYCYKSVAIQILLLKKFLPQQGLNQRYIP